MDWGCMTKYLSGHKLWLPVVLSIVLVGCLATYAQWMAYVYVDPDNFNEVTMNSSGQVVHISEQADGLHLATYDETGLIAGETLLAAELAGAALDIPGKGLLVAGTTLASTKVVDVNTNTVTDLEASMIPEGAAQWPVTAAASALNQVVLHGVFEEQVWLLLLDFETQSSQLLTLPGTALNGAFGFDQLIVEVQTQTGRDVVSFDSALNEIARFTLADNNEALAGASLGRPVLFNSSNHNVRVVDSAGTTEWEYENDFEYVEGVSAGPDGHVLLWGDNASLNPLSGVVFDSAHFLMVSAEGELLYHYLGGSDMANIAYTNVKHFAGGMVQVSYQGWTGQLAGLVIGSNLGTPFAVTRQVFHDFITLKGNRTRFMREPKRVDTYSQCGTFCVELVSEVEGHCDNLDVFNVNANSLVSVSQVCGAKDELGGPLPDTVKVSLF